MAKIEIPDLKGKQLYDWLIENKSLLISQKKFEMKCADTVSYFGEIQRPSGKIVKAATGTASNIEKDMIEVTAVINTTYWYDSHGDVHIDGLWNKSIKENPNPFHLQEHVNSFKNLISRDVRAYTKRISWKSLGIDFPGSTEALVFDSNIKRKTNPEMFDRYVDGEVQQHSVGMRYVKLDLAINDEDYPAYHELWKKYIDKIANRSTVEDAGYFWPVTEAKAAEGSAVLMASNSITPTMSIKSNEPPKGTHTRTAKSVRKMDELNKLSSLLKTVK